MPPLERLTPLIVQISFNCSYTSLIPKPLSNQTISFWLLGQHQLKVGQVGSRGAVVSVQTALEPVSLEISTAQKRFTSPSFIKVVMTVLTLLSTTQIDLVTVFDAILTSRQTREQLQCFYENLMSNNFRKTAFLKNI